MQKIDINNSEDIVNNIDDNNNHTKTDNTSILKNYDDIKLNMDYKEEDNEKLEKEVIELVEIFNTVQDLVVNQKGIINVIENNIDNANEYVVITQNDLDEIEKIKKNNANKKTIIYSFGVIMISIPISVLAGPILGVTFAVLGVGGIKGYSSYIK
jgi:t-SNARE complex subunit (syntaxin)